MPTKLSTTPAATSSDVPENFHAKLAGLAPELFGRALRIARSPERAEDLVQDTVERAIRFQGSYQAGTNLRAWVHQILFSVFVTECRRGRRERRALSSLGSDPCAWTLPDPATVSASLSPPVARALDSLPPGFRDAIVLVDIEELSYKHAASLLGVPVGTIMSRLHRGRRALADAMGLAPPCVVEGGSGGPEVVAEAA